MSRPKVPTIHGVFAESALVLLEQQRLVWPREVVLRAWKLHGDQFELEQRRLVMQSAERLVKRAAQGRGGRHLPRCRSSAPGGADRMTKRDANRLPRGAQRATLTADEYRALIQALVDQARADQSTAERLADEARLRFEAENNVPTETE